MINIYFLLGISKRLLYKSGLSILIFILSLYQLSAQDIQTKRIEFEKGQSGTTIEASITGDEIIDYLVNVQKGQGMNVSMATDNGANYFNIMEPSEKYEAIFNGSINENMFEGVLQKSGDYRIRVYLMRSAARRNETANYRLEVFVSAFDNKSSQEDAKVEGTPYNATGKIPCSMGNGQPTGNCDFGVVRKPDGGAEVTVNKNDGTTRTIYFENGSATGYDMDAGDQEKFSTSKNNDLFIINIGNERYEIPEAVIFGG